LTFSPALPTGVEADRAWFDLLLEAPAPLEEVRARLGQSLPEGFGILEVGVAEGRKGPEGPVVYGGRRADGAGAPGSRAAAEELLRAPGRVPGLIDVEWRTEAIRIHMEPGAGGARLRAALAALGLTGPDAPPVVVRAVVGEPPLALERTLDRTLERRNER